MGDRRLRARIGDDGLGVHHPGEATGDAVLPGDRCTSTSPRGGARAGRRPRCGAATSPTCCLPSQAPRGGPDSPAPGRSASPFILKATRQSSSAFSSRDRAGHCRGVGALGHASSLPLVLTPASSSRCLQRHARVHDVVDHAMRELAAVQLRAAPLHARVGGALEKVGRGSSRGKRFRSSMVKTSGRSTRPLIIKRCCSGCDFRDASVMAFKAETVRRDDAVKRMKRREVHR